jgi:hypothetical protein
VIGGTIQRGARLMRNHIERQPVLLTPLAGLAIGVAAIVFSQVTGKADSNVLFSGQEALPTLVRGEATYTVEALLLLILCKSLAYGISLGGFRGGPVFPAIFIGGVMGVLFARLPGLPLTAGLAMGIGAMATVMLRMPMTAVLMASLLLGQGGVNAMPLVIVAVVIAYVATEAFSPSDQD